MSVVLNDLLLFSCLTALVTGIVIAAAMLIIWRWKRVFELSAPSLAVSWHAEHVCADRTPPRGGASNGELGAEALGGLWAAALEMPERAERHTSYALLSGPIKKAPLSAGLGVLG